MAVLASNMSGHIQNQLTRSLERILEDAHLSGELKLSGRKLKDFPKPPSKFTLSDTVIADLSKNKFSELPEEVTGFPFLERLHLYHNTIRIIPDTVCSLQSLTFIDLSRNQLTTLPREICQLPLQILLVSNNRLSSLPDELGRMSQLTELDASCNHLTHLPPRMDELPCLQSLLLRNNFLLCVPVEITKLDLVRLDLRANRISSLPIEMRGMTRLIELMVDDNPLTSPPASLCRRGRVHIFKYLEIEAIKQERKGIGIGGGGGTLGRRGRRSHSNTPTTTPTNTGAPSHLPERLRHKRHNVDSGYSTSDGFDKRWSQEMQGDADSAKSWSRGESTPASSRSHSEINGTPSGQSTPSTISPGPDQTLEDDTLKVFNDSYKDELRVSKELASARLSPCSDPVTNGNGMEEKSRPFQQIQTYREYKEALKQQRAQDSHSIYRTKDPEDQSSYNKTEPNTPTHTSSSSLTRTTLATSKSDPTPLNSALSSPKHIFDDTASSPKRPVQKVPPSRNVYQQQQQSSSPASPILNGNSHGADTTAACNGKNGGAPPPVAAAAAAANKYIQDYIKPNSPVKYSTGGILSHDNVPPPSSPRHATASPTGYAVNGANGVNGTTKTNGVKPNRSISWNREVTPDKLSFTMRREFDKAREESDLIHQLRQIIETRLKMVLPEDLAPALTDGVVLCHLANHVRPRSVGSIHVPSPAVPKLTMARCRRNVDNFLEACRRIGVEENLVCCSADVLEGRGLVQIAITVAELLRFHHPNPRSPLHTNSNNVGVPTVI